MKRIFAILLAVAMLAVVAFGCVSAVIDEPEETTQPAEVAANVQQALEDFLVEEFGEDWANTEFLLYDLDGNNTPVLLVRQERGGFDYDVFRYQAGSFVPVGEIARPLAFYRDNDGQPIRRNGAQFEHIAFGSDGMTLASASDVDTAQLTRIDAMTALRQSMSARVTQRLVDGGYIDPNATTIAETTTTTTATNADGMPVTTQAGQTTVTQAGGTTTTTTTRPGTTVAGQTTTTTTRPPTTTAGGGGNQVITSPQGTTAPPQHGNADRVLTTPISVANNQAAALAQFNTSVNRIVSQNAGFNKRHQVTHPHFTASDDFTYAGLLGMANMVSPAVVHVLGNMPTGSVRERGHSTQMIRQSQLTAGDINSATATQAGNGNWTITVNVRNSSSSSPGNAGTAHVARGPIHRQTDPGGAIPLPIGYDHNNAAQLRSSLTEGLSIFGATVAASRVQENTSAARYVLTLDRYGNPISLICIFTQHLDFDIQFPTNLYRNNRVNYTTTITFDGFRFR
ncbi:MAG: hypothetical protein FWD06_08840 [Oscillospiraceae bacterium]|nr:hypothetical protein [Oscillospiraceae bacterium]